MCLVMKFGSKIERNPSDLIVYKVLDGDKSPFYDFPYKKHTLYRLRKALYVFGPSYARRIAEGFHAYLNPHIPSWSGFMTDGIKVVKMTIPKGAMVAYGVGGDIVSTSIRSGSLRDVRHTFR